MGLALGHLLTPYLDLGRTNEPHRVQLQAALTRVLDSGWYVLGEEVAAFEHEWAAFTERTHCVGVGNALDGLTLTLQSLGAGPGDEVLVPSNTYIATWLAVSAVGATPVPVEPSVDTLTMDPEACRAALTPRTVGVMPVHLFGRLTPPAVTEIARANALWVVADAAQSHGARRATSDSDADVYSFYPTKNLGCLGDGGAVVTDDADLADRLRLVRNYGSRVKYLNEVRGRNSRLDELQAAVLRVKLPALEAENARRRELAERYIAGLAGVVETYSLAEPHENVWHVFTVRTPHREALRTYLDGHGVGTQIFYPIPPHLSAAYEDMRWPELPFAERLAEETLALPIAPYLSDAEVDQVVRTVREAVA